MNDQKAKIVHVITSSGVGGAEMALYYLVKHAHRERFEHEVISLAPIGPVGEKIASLGIAVHSLNLSGGWRALSALPRLSAMLQRSRAALVHCWMYHANLLGGLAAWRAGRACVWSIRHNDLNPALLKRSTIWVARLGAKLSGRLPRRIIYCSQSAQSEHQRLGYDSSKGVFIPNGFDTETFRPDREAGKRARQALGITAETLVIGHVGRFHPTKDHLTLLRAARIAREARPDLTVVLCGSGVDERNAQLRGWIDELGLAACTRLIGAQEDMLAVYNMMDVLVSSSLSEAFPNVIGEAMSCGVACAATDAGDAALIIGERERMAPPGNPERLAAAILPLLADAAKRRKIGWSGRQRIERLFSMEQMVEMKEALYEEVLREKDLIR